MRSVFLLLFSAVLLIQCAPRAHPNPDSRDGLVINECRGWQGDVAAALQACEPGAGLTRLDIVSPVDGAVLPPDLAPPLIKWRDPSSAASLWVVAIAVENRSSTKVVTDANQWDPEPAVWARLKATVGNDPFVLEIYGLDDSLEPVSYAQVRLQISKDPLDAAILYMEMPLPFSFGEQHPETFRWRLADLASTETPKLLAKNLPSCSNCHSVSRDGTTMGMDIDLGGDKGAYALFPLVPDAVVKSDHVISWNDLPGLSGRKSMGLFSKISPSGRYVASTVWERSFFAYLDDVWYSQFFFPIKGAVAIYDATENTFFPLPGADQERLVQTCPDWHPDGKSLVFSRAVPSRKLFEVLGDRKVLPTSSRDRIRDLNQGFRIRFDLYHIPFNNGRGGTPKPLAGGSENGHSNYFPRHSPDGEWILFTRSPNGLAIQPESELWIIPAEGGKARRLACNLSPMNSWHSWSPNGRWVAFSSKAAGPYTQIYLAHIDRQGVASPPVLMWRLMSPGYACIVPELVPRSVLRVRSLSLSEKLAAQ